MEVDNGSKNWMKQRKHQIMGFQPSLRLPIFHLELVDIHKSQKIDTIGIWA